MCVILIFLDNQIQFKEEAKVIKSMKILKNIIVDQGQITFLNKIFIKILFIRRKIINMNNIGIINTINKGIINPTEIIIHITEANHSKSTKRENQPL